MEGSQGGYSAVVGYRATFSLGIPGHESAYRCLCYLQRQFIVNGETWELVAVKRPIAIMLAAHVCFLLPLGGRTSQGRHSVDRKQTPELVLSLPLPQAHPENRKLFLPVLGISQYGQPGLELHFVLVNRTKGPVGLLHCSTHLITSFRYTDAIEFIAQDGLGK